MTYLFSNNAATTLAVAIDDVVTQLTVLDASLFPLSVTPSNPCKVTLQDVDTGEIEICDCTDITGNVLTVVRGQENTASISFPIGAIVHHRLTAENLANFVQDLENVGNGEGEIAHSRVGAAARFKTLKQGPNTTISNGADEVTIESTDTASGANLGSTPDRQGIYADNTGTQLNLKSLVGGTDIDLTADGEEVTIDYTGTGGAGGPGNIPTGVYTGGKVSINADQTSVDVTAGTGVIVDAYTNPDAPVYTDVSWGDVNVNIYPSLASFYDSIVLSIEAGGTFVERNGGVNRSWPVRSKIDIAVIKVTAGIITSVIPFKSVVNTNLHAFLDYYGYRESAFFLNEDHKEYLTPQSGLRLHFNSGFNDGIFFSFNARYDVAPENPHRLFRVVHGGSSFEVTRWKYVDTQNTVTSAVLDLDPANYDAGDGPVPVGGPAGAATIQYIWHAPKEGDFIEYGQHIYDTIDLASENIARYYNDYRTAPTISRGWILIGAIAFWKGATNCLNTNHARVYMYRNGIFHAPFISKSVSDDPAPILAADLQTNGYGISIQDSTPTEQGRIEYDATIDGVYLGFIADDTRGFDPLVDGGVLAKAGELTLSGSVVELNAFKGGSDNLQVYVSGDGVLFGVVPPAGGWEEVDTDNADYTFPTLGAWVHIAGLIITVPEVVDVGDRIDAFVNLYFQELSGNRGGSIDIGIGLNGAEPTIPANNVRMEGGFDSVISTSLTTTAHGGIAVNDTISVFVRRASQDQAQFNPNLLGSIDPSELIVSVPGSGGGGGGDPTNLGNIPGASSVTITSSTGSNTVLPGATTGPNGAGVMTEAQVASLAAKIDDGANVGTGEATLFRDKTTGPNVLNIKRLQQGANITLTNNADEVIIEAAGGTGGGPVTLPVKVAPARFVPAGAGVVIVGWDAGSNRPLVEGADAASAAVMPVAGFALAAQSADDEFDLPVYGVFDYDTSGWNVGDRLYQANFGSVGTTPFNVDGVEDQELAKVLTSSVTGKLFVNPDSHGLFQTSLANPPDAAYGYLREGGGSPQWVRGSRVWEAGTEPVGISVGDHWFRV